jgi:transketolase
MAETLKTQATRDAYGEALVELGNKNKKIVVLDADLSKSTKTCQFAARFPERFFNMGIAEADMMGTAAGFAVSGYIPFASTFAVFATGRAYDQIRNSIAYPHVNVKIAATHAGLTVGEDGASHQSLEDLALMRVLPNMTVLVPADGWETTKVMAAALKVKGPVYVRLGRPKVPFVTGKKTPFEIGRGEILREGKDVTIIACGIMVAQALEAASLLEKKGVDARVVNMASLKPLDEDLLVTCAKDTGALVTAEEHSILGGLGGAVAECVGSRYPVPVIRIGVRDTFGESGEPGELLKKYGLSPRDIVDAVGEALSKKRR